MQILTFCCFSPILFLQGTGMPEYLKKEKISCN
nr:MAG TPA: hypothetical protein [Caudoviricetes sp.]